MHEQTGLYRYWGMDSHGKQVCLVCRALARIRDSGYLATALGDTAKIHSLLRNARTASAGNDSASRVGSPAMDFLPAGSFGQRSRRSTDREAVERSRAIG